MRLAQTSFDTATNTSTDLLHFVWGHSRGEMYSGHGRLCVCVCLSLAAFPHYCTHPDVTLVPSSCALLGEFAIGSQVPLL